MDTPQDPAVGEFSKLAMPIVRRVYPQLIANKIVSVQPMMAPTALKYYMNYRYASQQEQQEVIPKKVRKKVWRDINEPWEPVW